MTFEARNDIEAHLIAAQEGKIGIDAFMEELLKAQLFLPVFDDKPIGNFQRSTSAKPLTIDTADGTTVLVVFTSPDRARDFVKDYPGYGGGILTELPWVFERMGIGFGISLNPGLEVGLDLEADDVARLAGRVGERAS